MAVFDLLFGWRKASKCKKLIRRVQCRLRLLRNKRDSIIRQSQGDISQLARMGYLEIATERAEQLLKDENVKELYELLDHFCEFIVSNFSYINRHRECPNDINEAVSSLIFASARCGELPELRRIRELLRERYGEKFTLTAINLLPGNLVNPKIRDRLSFKLISDDSKFRVVNEFARDQLRIPEQPEILAIEYASELHKQIEEMAERQPICHEIVAIGPETIADLGEEDVATAKIEKKASSTALASTEDVIRVSKSQSQPPRLTNSTSPEVDSIDPVASCYKLTTALSCSEKRESGTASSADNSPRFPELNAVYLDDVEELRYRRSHDEDGLADQRFFKFRPSIIPRSTKPQEFPAAEKESLSPHVQVTNKAEPGRSLRRRLVWQEPETIEESKSAAYYSLRSGKHLSMVPRKAEHVNTRPSKVTPTSVRHKSHSNSRACSKTRDYARGNRGTPPDIIEFLVAAESSSSSDSEEEERLLLIWPRAMTMPTRRQSSNERGRMPRSNSSPLPQQPNHVHPKLPDYDELAARFNALKEERLADRRKPPRFGKQSWNS